MSMSSADESLLKQWFNERDADAFKAICSRHAGMVYATCVRILRNETEAEDVVQSCFESLSGLRKRPRGPLGPWLHRVATNRALDVLKLDKRRKAREERFFVGRESHTEILWEDIYEFVDEAIEELPRKLRVALVAHFLEDETHDSIARREGVSRAAITQRIGRGIERIRRTLKRRGISVASSALGALLATEKAIAVPPSLAASLGKLALVGMKSHGADVSATVGNSWSFVGSTVTHKAVLAGAFTILATAGVVAILMNKGRDIPLLLDDNNAQSEIPEEVATVIEPPQEDEVSTLAEPVAALDEVEGSAAADETQNVFAAPVVAEAADSRPLPESRSVSGYVVDERGRAIGGAIVSLAPFSYAFKRVSPLDDFKLHPHLQRTSSDARGFFSISDIRTESAVFLAASAPGYVSNRRMTSGAVPGVKREDVVLTLNPGFNLYGEIRDTAGQPIPGALLENFGWVREGGRRADALSRFAVADSQGRFLLGFRTSGLSTIGARTDALGGTIFADVPVGADELIVLQWPEGGILEGTIIDTDQYRSDDLILTLVARLAVEGSISMGISYSEIIRDDGRYRIEGISTVQDYTLQIRLTNSGDELTPRIPLDVFEDGKTQVFDYILEQTVSLSGTVRGVFSGQPLRDVSVRWQSLENPELTDTVEVNDDGTYSFELRVPAGRYVVYPRYRTMDWPEYQEPYMKTVDIVPGTESVVDLELFDSVTRTVLVVDEFGAPIVDARILYIETDSEPQLVFEVGTIWGSGMGETDEEGRFTHSGIRPYKAGGFHVRAIRTGYGDAYTEFFAAEPGQVFEEEVVVLYFTEE